VSLKAQVEAIIYVAEEPVTAAQLVTAIQGSGIRDQGSETPIQDDVQKAVKELIAEYAADARGLEIKEVAGGYKMATKPEHHEVVRQFIKQLKPPMKLSLAALETLAVIAYRQPVTLPEIQEVRGVNAGAVLKNLLDKKLITTAGRKNVIGRPILYRTTRDFLVQFGLKDLSELPSLKEFEELARAAGTLAEAPEEASPDHG
jgi:segregation and condensation protein B